MDLLLAKTFRANFGNADSSLFSFSSGCLKKDCCYW
jgi:hypothetical protein